MKTISIILSAAVCAGLGSYALLSGVFGLGLQGNQVVINIELFIAFVATTAIVGAALALLFRWAIARGDEKLFAKLERRVVELEARAAGKGQAAV